MLHALWFCIIGVLISFSIVTSGSTISTHASLIDVTPRPPLVLNTSGDVIQNTTVGHPVVITREFTNTKSSRIDFTYLMEIRDEDGVTQYLAWQTGSAFPMDTKRIGISWIPDTVGAFQIRTLVVSNLTNTGHIEAVETTEFTVFDSRKMLTLDVYGTRYDIEYLLDFGFVSRIDYDVVLATITVDLDGVTRATELDLRIPKAMLDEDFMCKIEAIPNSSIDGLVILVDTVETNMKAMETAGSLIVPVKLEAGAELVEVIGCAVP